MSYGLASMQLSRDRQPQPMHSVRLSRSRDSCRMRASRSVRQYAETSAQSPLSGVRPSGSRASAVRIAFSGMPTFCETRMNATRRSMSRV